MEDKGSQLAYEIDKEYKRQQYYKRKAKNKKRYQALKGKDIEKIK